MTITKDQIVPMLALLLSIGTGLYSYANKDGATSVNLDGLLTRVEKIEEVTKLLPTLEAKLGKTISYSVAHNNKLKELEAIQGKIAIDNAVIQRQLSEFTSYEISNESWKKETEKRIRNNEANSLVNTGVLKELASAVSNLSSNTRKQTEFFEQVARNDERLKYLEEKRK